MELKELGDKIAGLSMLQARGLCDYLADEYGIEPPPSAVEIIPDEPKEGEPEKTEFTVKLVSFGEKKLDVVKAARTITGLSLIETKKLVEAAPVHIRELLPLVEATKIKEELEAAGATVELV